MSALPIKKKKKKDITHTASHTQNDTVPHTSSELPHCKSIRLSCPQTQLNRPSSITITLPDLAWLNLQLSRELMVCVSVCATDLLIELPY